MKSIQFKLKKPNRPHIPRLAAIFILTAVTLFGWVTVAHAQSFRSGNNSTVAADQTVDSTLFMSGRTIDIAGDVNGDVFCAGQNITITGHVMGDVICAGQTVRVSGDVDGDVRVAGQTVTVGGQIGGNLTMAGQTATTEGNSQVADDVSVTGQDVTLNGRIGRDLAIASSNATLNGDVGRNIQAAVEKLALGGSATVQGNITYTSQQDISRAGGSQVVGKVTHNQPQAPAKDEGGSNGWLFALWFFVAMLLLALVLVLIMPRAFQRSVTGMRNRWGKVFLLGVAASFITPLVIIILFASLVGIPLAVLLLLSWLVVQILAGPYAAYLLGRYLVRLMAKGKSVSPVLTMLFGATVLLLVYAIPILGFIVLLLALWTGIGMVLLQVWHLFLGGHRRDSDHKPEALKP